MEAENAQLKDKLLRADATFAESHKASEQRLMKEITYLEKENLELMEEITQLREVCVCVCYFSSSVCVCLTDHELLLQRGKLDE